MEEGQWGQICHLWEKVLGQCDNRDTKKQDPSLRGEEGVGMGNGEMFPSLSLCASPTETLALRFHGVCVEIGKKAGAELHCWLIKCCFEGSWWSMCTIYYPQLFLNHTF